MTNCQNTNKKILIITRDFLPYNVTLGGTIRVLKMAEFLVDNGIEVYVLSAKGKNQVGYFGYEKLVHSLNVIYLEDWLKTKQIDLKIRQSRYKAAWKADSRSAWARLVKELFVPDPGICLVSKYVKMGVSLIRENKINNILVTSPPHSTQIIGLRIKKLLGGKINLIVDYRDSWNTTGLFQKKIWPANYLNRKFEKQVLTRADWFTFVSPAILRKINSDFFDITHKAIEVMNGFDIGMFTDAGALTRPKSNKLSIAYFGSIDDSPGSFRDPTRFFRVLPKFADRLSLVFYGQTKLKSAWLKELKGMLEIKEEVSHKEAIMLMRNYDLLLILHSELSGADEVITGKLFDYILAQRPILVIGPSSLEAGKMVLENKLGYYGDLYDKENMTRTLNRTITAWDSGDLPKYAVSDLICYSRQYQYSKLISLLV